MAGRKVGIRRRQRPRRKPSPRPSRSSPAPGRALSPPTPSPPAGAPYPSRRRLRHGRSRPTTPTGGRELGPGATPPTAWTSGSRHRRGVDTRCILGTCPLPVPRRAAPLLPPPRGVSTAPQCSGKLNCSLPLQPLSMGYRRKIKSIFWL